MAGTTDDVVIGVDAGTQSIRAMAFDLSGRLVAETKARQNMRVDRPGWAEQQPEQWWAGLCACLRQLAREVDASRIAALSIAYQRETFVLLDAKANPLRPAILWLDQRAISEALKLENLLGSERFHQITGKQLDTTPSSVKLLWILDNEPGLLKDTWKLADVGAYLHYRLTGELVSPVAGADSLACMDLERRTWSSEILGLLDLSEDQVPEIAESGCEIGAVSQEAAQETRLKAGTPVIAGGGDGQVFAIGCRSLDATTLAANLGTAVTFGVHSTSYLISPYFRTMAGCLPGTFLCESVLRSGSQTVSWFVNAFAGQEVEVGRLAAVSPEQLLESEAKQVRPGCDGLMTVPYWRGAMMPYRDPRARGITLGWSDYHTRAHFFRSILEGIAFEMRLVESGLAQRVSKRPDVIHAGGGGATSRLWCSIISDVLDRDVVISATQENTALGAAMLAACGAGYYESLEQASTAMFREGELFHADPANRQIYDRLFNEVYKKVYPQIRSLSRALGDFALLSQTQA